MRLLSLEESLKIWDTPLSEEHFKELVSVCNLTWEMIFFSERPNEEYKTEKRGRVAAVKNNGDAFVLLQMLHAKVRWEITVPMLSPELQEICKDAFGHEATYYTTNPDGTISIESPVDKQKEND